MEDGSSYLTEILKGKVMKIDQLVEKGTTRLAEHEKLHTSCEGLLEIRCEEWVGLEARRSAPLTGQIVAFVSNQRAGVEVRSR